MGKQRVDEIEILRALAFLVIVLQHVMAVHIGSSSMSLYSSVLSCVVLTIIRFGVPAFIFMTGFVLFYNYKSLDYPGFIRKRFVQVILPYLVWSIFYSWVSSSNGVIFDNPTNFLWETAGHILRGDAAYHLWFMVLIIQFYILFPLFKKPVERLNERGKWGVLLKGLAVFQFGALMLYHGVLPAFYRQDGNGIINGLIYFRDRNFLFWIFYFVLGGVLALNLERGRELLRKYLPFLISGWLITFAYVLYVSLKSGSYNASGGYSLNYNITSPTDIRMFFYLVFSILLLYHFSGIFLRKFPKASRLLMGAGKYSFGGYLIHAYVIMRIYEGVMGLFSGAGIFVNIALLYLLTAAITISSVALLRKIPLIRTLTGS